MKLSEMCLGITDGSHNPPKGIERSEFLMISSKNIFDNHITLDNPRYLTKYDFENENKRTNIRPGDVLLTIVGTVGRAAVVDENIGRITLQRSVAVLHPNKNICDSRYLMYLLLSKKDFFEQEARGVAQKGIYLKQLSDIEFLVYNRYQQLDVVHKLDKVQRLITMEKECLKKYDELVKSRFWEMFNLDSYHLASLGECTDFIDYRGHTPSLSDEGSIRMVNAKSVGKGYFKYVNEFITEDTYNSWMHRGYAYPGDILFVTEGHTFGNTCQVPEDLTKFALGQRVITIRGHVGIIENTYLCMYMQMTRFFQDISVYRTGGTAQGIRSKDLIKINIPIPPIKLQKEFSNFVQYIAQLKFLVRQSVVKLEILNKALMQKYFG